MKVALSRQNTFFNYVDVLKPRETCLLTFIGVCSAVIAAGGRVTAGPIVLVAIAILLGSAGSNGLTNYLDRKVDARMLRTCNRSLPSGRIHPPEKVLPLIVGLILGGLVIACFLHPLCFLIGLIGVLASGILRKTMTCTFLGIVAGCSPVLIGLFAFRPEFNIQALLLCSLVAAWTPIHVWSVMIAHRDDYLGAGLSYIPLNWKDEDVVKVLFGLSLLLYVISLLLFFFSSGFHILYLMVANVLGIIMVSANARLLVSTTSSEAWRVYKLSAFPYIGIMFFTMCLDIWLL